MCPEKIRARMQRKPPQKDRLLVSILVKGGEVKTMNPGGEQLKYTGGCMKHWGGSHPVVVGFRPKNKGESGV